MSNEKISRFMDSSGFFGGNFEDLTLDFIDEYFTEENFKNLLGYDDEMLEKIAYDFDFDDGVMNWSQIRIWVYWELRNQIIDYVKESDCSLTYDVNESMKWAENYDGELEELDPDDFDSEEEMEEYDDERRAQYWDVTGKFARNRDDWEKILLWIGYEKDDNSWKQAERLLDEFHYFVDDELFPIVCSVEYDCGFEDNDPNIASGIEGSGTYDMTDY